MSSKDDRPVEQRASDKSDAPIRLVAIGASAGGLEPFEQFFGEIPPDTGLAFVVVQHLSPNFKSMMNEILARHSAMEIRQIEDGMAIEPNTIYLNQPRLVPTVEGNTFRVTDTSTVPLPNLPINVFFESLAQERGRDSIGVIFSGTGADGTQGCEIIKAVSGTIFVQEPDTAKFDGMPNSVINRQLADHIADPTALAALVLAHAAGLNIDQANLLEQKIEDPKTFIFSLLQERFGTDFMQYKDSTIDRRIRRRFAMLGLSNIHDYADLLETDPNELSSLYDDLLIDVTAFFRDTEAFKELDEKVIADICQKMDENHQIRIWVAACSSGEEPYSIAMMVAEYAERHKKTINVKILATDIHSRSLQSASEGFYPESSLQKISAERIAKYFVKQGDRYQIIPQLRRSVVFSSHNLFTDPPFTKMDLVSCRNMLIYLREPAQNKAIALFHFALRKDGYLFLGPSETLGKVSSEFEMISQRWRIFRKKRDVRLMESTTILRPEKKSVTRLNTPRNASYGLSSRGASLEYPDVRRAFNRALQSLLTQYAPTGFLITRLGDLFHIFGDAGEYINVSSGGFSQRIVDLVHPDLQIAMSAGLERMKGFVSDTYTRRTSITLSDGEVYGVTISMAGLPDAVGTIDFLLVTVARDQEKKKDIPKPIVHDVLDKETLSILQDRIYELERDLSSTEESLQTTIEELETSNEELQATNEELMASNEELQSTNEELHSVNEELYTVSSEHQRKIEELTELTNDMEQLLLSTDIGTIFLTSDLEIRRFTQAATETFNLYPQDIGRPLDHITHKFGAQRLIDLIKSVRKTQQPTEEEASVDGKHYVLRVMPYKPNLTADLNFVVLIIDITDIRDAAKQVEAAAHFSNQVLGDITDYVVRWKMPGGKITYINEAYKHFIEAVIPSWDQKNIYDVIQKGRRKDVKSEFLAISPGETIRYNFEGRLAFETDQHFAGNIRSVGDENGNVEELQWTAHDVTPSVRYQKALSSLLEIDKAIEHDVISWFNKVLEIGAQYYGLEYGILVKNEEKGFQLEGYFPTDETAHKLGTHLEPHERSIFGHVKQSDTLIVAADIANSDHAEFNFATKANCTTFIGIPVRAEGQPYGVIGFYSKSGKVHPEFTELEIGFIRLISQWVGFKLEGREAVLSLARNEAELQFIFDNMPARIWYKDDENTILRLNQRAAESMELSVEAATNASTYDLFPAMAKKYHEDDLKVFKSGKPLMNIVEEYTPKDGEQGWVATDKVPFINPKSGERRILVAARDITELKKQESELLSLNAALEEQKGHYLSLYRKTPVMMHSFDKTGTIIEVSDQWIKKLGYARQDVIGKKPTDFMTPEAKQRFPEQVKGFWKTGKVDSLPYQFVRKDGTIIDVEVSGLVDKSNKAAPRSLGVLVDVTERNRAKAQLLKKNEDLEQAIEQVSQFAYLASHDLQEPLRKIKVFSEFLTEDFAEDLGEKGQKFLLSIIESANRMSSLIRALLEYSRTTDGDLTKERLSLNDLIKDIESDLDDSITQASATITYGDLGTVEGDKTLVRQLLLNLFANAIKYSRDGQPPKIKVSTKTLKSGFVIEVRDNGMGIEAEYLDVIFNPFTRLGNNNERKGSGIGLAICKSVCDRHGWSINARSKVGKGTSFHITIPDHE